MAENKDVYSMTLRVDKKIKEWIATRAKKNRRSISAELNMLLDDIITTKNRQKETKNA